MNVTWRNDGSGYGDIEGRDDIVMHDCVHRHPIKGAKAGSEPRSPKVAKDTGSSTSIAKIMYGLSEGTVEGLADGGKSIFLNGTPLLDDAGNENFEGVTWDFRSGTNEQEYIKGFPDVSNEIGVNVELKSTAPWVKAINNSELSAIRLRFKWDRLSVTNSTNGDVSGHRIDYAIDLQTAGGAYVEIINTSIVGKYSAGYERTHRIDLPRSTTGWQVRVRRLTPNVASDFTQDTMRIEAITEVIDVKLAYPNTSVLGIQYPSETFNSIAKIEIRLKGMIIRVPSNYDPVARTYSGLWDGTFKDAYTNNPAWIYFDLCTQWRYGLGNRLTADMIDKWTLYALGQYCDQMVSDGKGGLEPRFACNVYLQKQADAYQVLQNLAGIFRALSFWNGEQVVLDADVPKDPVYTFSRSNVVDGNFEYPSTRQRDRHTLVKVAWDNPNNAFQTEYEYVRDEKAIAKFGVKILDLSAFGCTSQAQAQRAGLWALKTELLETRQVIFSSGLDGINISVGNIINISDELFAGRANGGRISAVSTGQTVVTIDRDITVAVGDILIVNTKLGKSERRNVKSVNGRKITVTTAFTGAESENVWAIETADLKLMRFRILSIKQNDDQTFGIVATQHEPQKYDAIDFGTDVKPTNITVPLPSLINPPSSVSITSRHRVVQGQTVATLVISWDQVAGAIGYEVEWRKDDGNWIGLPRTDGVSAEVDGVYSGNYLARVRSVSAFDSLSKQTISSITNIKGKVGAPPTVANIAATGVLFGMKLKWLFAAGSGDIAYTEIEVGTAPSINVSTLGKYSYPTDNIELTGLSGGLSRSYRARTIDKLGNVSAWSSWTTAITSSDAGAVLTLLDGKITESQLFKDLGDKITSIGTNKSILDGLGIDVSAIDSALSVAKNSIATAQGDIAKAKTDITSARGVADAAKGSADANKTTLTALSTTVGDNKTSVDQSITTLTNKDASLTNLYTALNSDYQGNKSSISQSLTTLTNKDQSLSDLITNLDTDYKGNKTSVSQALTALSNKDASIVQSVAAAQTKADGNSTKIATIEIQQSTNTIAIASTKSDLVATTNKIDNLKVGVSNLLKDSRDKSLPVTQNTHYYQTYYLTEPLVVGQQYTFSAKVKILGTATDSISYFDYYGGAVRTIPYNNGNLRGTFIATSTEPNRFLVYAGVAGSTQGRGIEIYFAQLEKGTVATDWKPALEDTQTLIDANVAAINAEALARTTRDSALTTLVGTAQSTANSNTGRISTAENTLATTTGSLATTRNELAATTGKLNGLSIGGRNLIKDSGIQVTSSAYGMAEYTLIETLVAGEPVTVTVWGKLGNGKQYFAAYNSGGRNGTQLIEVSPNVHQATFNWPVEYSNTFLRIYHMQSETVIASTIYRAKLERGNKGTDWSEAGTLAYEEANNNLNLYNFETADIGKYLGTNGALFDAISHRASDFIAVRNNTTYTASIDPQFGQFGNLRYCLYDVNKNFIKYDFLSNVRSHTFTTTADTKYLKISAGSYDEYKKWVVTLGSLILPWTPSRQNTGAFLTEEATARATRDEAITVLVNSAQAKANEAMTKITNEAVTIANNTQAIGTVRSDLVAQFSVNENLFSIADSIAGYETNGDIRSSTPSHQTMQSYVPINGGDKVIFQVWNPNLLSSGNSNRVAFYTSSKAYISSVMTPKLVGTALNSSNTIAPSNARFMRIGMITGVEDIDPSVKIKVEIGTYTAWSPNARDAMSNTAAIRTESKARADADGAVAESVTKLQTVVTKNTALYYFDMNSDFPNWPNYSGAGNIFASTAGVGIGDNSGNDQQWIIRNENIEAKRGVVYRITARYWNRYGTGRTYVGVAGVASNGTTWVNNTGADSTSSQYYVGSDSNQGGWEEITGYVASSGTNISGLPNAINFDPAVKFFRPLLIANYSGQAGTTYFEYFKVEIVDSRNTASVEQAVSSVNGLAAEWTLKLDVNGYVSGIGQYNNGTTSQFAVRADNFYVANPNTKTTDTMFQVLTSPTTVNGVSVPAGVYMKDAYIKNASINLAKINVASITSLTALSSTIGHFKSATTGARLEIKDSLLSVYDSNNRLRVRLGLW